MDYLGKKIDRKLYKMMSKYLMLCIVMFAQLVCANALAQSEPAKNTDIRRHNSYNASTTDPLDILKGWEKVVSVRASIVNPQFSANGPRTARWVTAWGCLFKSKKTRKINELKQLVLDSKPVYVPNRRPDSVPLEYDSPYLQAIYFDFADGSTITFLLNDARWWAPLLDASVNGLSIAVSKKLPRLIHEWSIGLKNENQRCTSTFQFFPSEDE